VSDRVCLRCDWAGEAGAGPCPRCGAALYERTPRVVATAAAATSAASPRPPRSGPPSSGTASGTELETALPGHALPAAPAPAVARSRRRRRVAVAGLVLLVAGFLWWRDAAQSRPGPALRGTLAYLARDGGGARVFLLDLRTRSVTPGAAAGRHATLVAVQGRPDVVGSLEVGRASLLRLDDPGAPPAEAWRGDQLAWSADGRVLARDRRSPGLSGRCTTLRIVVETLGGPPEDVYGQPECRAAAHLDVDGGGSVYVSFLGEPGPLVTRVQNGNLVAVRAGLVVRSLSASGAMLLSPPPEPTGDAFDPGLPARTLLSLDGGGTTPALVAGRQGPLLVQRVLAWSADGGRVAVAGVLGNVRAVWVVETTSDGAGRAPRRAGPALALGEPVGATFGVDGTLFVVARGRVAAWMGGRAAPVALPSAAPRPLGPVAWLPAA
jgi:hypothetical protein